MSHSKDKSIHKKAADLLHQVMGRYCLHCHRNKRNWTKGKNRCDDCVVLTDKRKQEIRKRDAKSRP